MRMHHWWAVAVCVVVIEGMCGTSFGQYGIWTSQNRNISASATDVPTPFGVSHGSVLQIGPFTEYLSAGDFGMLYDSSQYNSRHMSWFTPDSLTVEFTNAYYSYTLGNLYAHGGNPRQHIEATFHLDQETYFTFGPPGPPFLVPDQHAPTMTGPGGVVINLPAPTSGMLAAGDWRFLLEFQAIYPGDDFSDVDNRPGASFH